MLTFPALAVEVVESVTTHCQTAAIVSGAVSMAIASLGLAVGALINFGGANGGNKELGLGLTLTPACDNAVTFLPFNSLENRADPAITLNEIQISDISSNCAGKDFIITARDNDE